MSTPKGYSSQEKEDRLSSQFSTVEPVRESQFGLSVQAHQFVYEVGTDAAEAGSTAAVLVATAHVAKRGDVIRMTSGPASGKEAKVWEVSANSIELAETLSVAPAAGNTFQVLRNKYPMVDASGSLMTLSSEVATAADNGALPSVVKVIGGYDGAAVQVIKTDAAGELQVDVLSSALPTGAATSANQTTELTRLGDVVETAPATDTASSGLNGRLQRIAQRISSLIGLFPATLGQKTAAGSLAVTVASDQSAIPASQSGTWNITNVSGTVSLPTGAATETTLSTLSGKVPSGLTVTSTRLLTDGSGVTQPVSAASLPLPTGAATETTLSALNGKVTTCNTGAVTVASSALPTGAATETTLSGVSGKLPATLGQKLSASSLAVTVASDQSAIPASQSGTWNINNIAGTVSLPTGAATETTLSGVSGKLPATLGQKVAASSLAVTVASDQSAIPASQSGTWNITNVSGTVSLPTGAATSANQSTELTRIGDVIETAPASDTASSGLNGRLQRIAQRLTSLIALFPASLGQKTAANSFAVTVASDQSAIPASQSGTWNITNVSGTVSLPTGAATETTLSSLNGKVTACNTGAVTISSPLPAGTNTIGNVGFANLSPVDFARLDYTSTNVTTSAYVQLDASVAGAVKEVEIFDSSGQTLLFAVGGVGSEVDKFFIIPGGNGRFPITIPASSRIAIKAVSATANSGEIAVNFLG